MSVQPIDLQNLLLRVDQLTREISAQQQAAAQQQNITGDEIARRTQRQAETVSELERNNDGPDTIHDDQSSSSGEREQQHKHRDSTSDNLVQVKDTHLGTKIDICR